MNRYTIDHLMFLAATAANEEHISHSLRDELKAALGALRQERAEALAMSEARLTKHNRPINPKNIHSFAPVDMLIGNVKLRIGDTIASDEIAERLMAAWNCCLGVPTQDLLTGHYANLRRHEAT